MGGHHAFNYPKKEVYWKDQTVRYHHEFVTKELGVPSEEIFYKEGVWSGGGNAGPDVESIVRGLEVATLVFMKFKVIGDRFVELPIRTVDTGYGIERYTWLSQGSPSCFHAIYGPVLVELLKIAGISDINEELLVRVAKFSSVMSLEKAADTREARKRVAKHVGMGVDELHKIMTPIESAYAIADHTKCLVFMLAEGVVPSNVREGYLTRLMIRRTYRLLRTLAIEEKLPDIIDMQIAFWSQDFPHLKEMRDEILEILSVERSKFRETLKRGGSLVRRIARELKEKRVSQIPMETLIELYDSHGLPPEVVRETAEREGVEVSMPENFYMMVAARHVQAPPPREVEVTKELEAMVSDLPETRMLYYEDPYLPEFQARVLRVLNNQHVVLEKTAFYPEGGGQPADRGYLKFNGTRSEVVDVQKIGNVIVHTIKGRVPREEDTVWGSIDWERRNSLMKHHTATHLLMGAARRVLGEHVWQAGAQKDVDKSRLDVSHFRRLTLEETHEIERLANQAVIRNLPVVTSWMPRQQAEKQYGFRLYQGGVVPGREIRVVETRDWEVEACGGTHLKNTGEIGFIKIVHTERIQDGVERIVFSAGLPALKAVQENEGTLWRVSEALNVPLEKVEKTADRLIEDWKEARREKDRLLKEIAKFKAKEYLSTAKEIRELKVVTQVVREVDVDRLIKTASELVKMEPRMVAVLCGVNRTVRIVVMAGKEAVKRGINARNVADATASILGGGGSGRPDFAQGGGTLIKKVPEALQKAEEVINEQLGGREID